MKLKGILFATALSAKFITAGIIPTLDGAAPTFVSPGVWEWTYTANVDGQEELNTAATGSPTGSFFTIYDINGLLTSPVIIVPAGWTDSIQLTGTTPSGLLLPDSPSVENVTFTYTGATTPGPLSIDGFSFFTSSNSVTTGMSSYQATKIDATGAALVGQDAGFDPVHTPGTPAATAEPASMLLISTGLIGLGLLGRKKIASD